MSVEEIILDPDPARIMESLRDTGYDFNTAIADLVDNSIAANASVVKINIVTNPTGEIDVYIADNGCGMDLPGLKNAMRYGSSERTDPSSLGKFGLGLKTASTAFCRCLSLLSKSSTSEYNKVQWDLDEICKINKWKLLRPEVNLDEVEILEEVTKGQSGTLVIWNKVDRLVKNSYSSGKARQNALERQISGLKQHISMVFERFLDKNFKDAHDIDIFVNGEKMLPWDPFCKREPNSNLVQECNPELILPDETKTKCRVAAYVLPRREDFSSQESYSQALINNDLEGFYVYRENRLIHHGDWLGIHKNDPHFNLLRIDFSFDHTLDDAFNVDIKKSRIMLDDGLFDFLKDQFLQAPRRAAEELYRKGQTSSIKKTATNAHNSSNVNIESKAQKVEQATTEVVNPDKKEVKVSNSQGTFITNTIRIQSSIENNQSRVIPVETIDSNMLWEPTLADNHHAVSINQSHPYYTKVYAPVLGNANLVAGMDSLLWALAEAEISTYNEETKEQYEDMRIQVSKILRKLVADLPDPEEK